MIDGEPNTETRIERLETFDGPDNPADAAARRRALYRLEPHSGKTHQLRVHMASLGAPIVNDAFYPVAQPCKGDDFTRPLQLLARSIAFVDPFTGEPREFASERRLEGYSE